MFEFQSLPGMAAVINSVQLDHAAALNTAVNQFQHARWKATQYCVMCTILRRSARLLDLSILSMSQIHAQYYGGCKPVGVDRICGSLGRTRDFDNHFHPLSERDRARWTNVALARMKNIPLPPVELIQVGSVYFVKDGHHRISVAYSLGEAAIDADIIVWEVRGPLPWEPHPAVSLLPLAV
jgi:hypothetical protein